MILNELGLSEPASVQEAYAEIVRVDGEINALLFAPDVLQHEDEIRHKQQQRAALAEWAAAHWPEEAHA
jgi:hypothetical protein